MKIKKVVDGMKYAKESKIMQLEHVVSSSNFKILLSKIVDAVFIH